MRKRSLWPQRAFVLAFVLLTSLVWCPWAYGTVPGRLFSIPTWAVVAYAVAAALFALEWVFLFASGLAVNDEEAWKVMQELEDMEAPTKDEV